MIVAMRGGLTAVGHCLNEDNDEQKPSKVRYTSVVQCGLSTGQKTFFAAATLSDHRFLKFWSFFKCLGTGFSYALWFMVARAESIYWS